MMWCLKNMDGHSRHGRHGRHGRHRTCRSPSSPSRMAGHTRLGRLWRFCGSEKSTKMTKFHRDWWGALSIQWWVVRGPSSTCFPLLMTSWSYVDAGCFNFWVWRSWGIPLKTVGEATQSLINGKMVNRVAVEVQLKKLSVGWESVGPRSLVKRERIRSGTGWSYEFLTLA
jgi:hypothetical protein